MPTHVLFSGRTKGSTVRKPSPLKSIPREKSPDAARYLSAQLPSPEISPDYTTANHTCAPAMESAIASGASGGSRRLCLPESTISRTYLLPIRDDPRANRPSSTPSPGTNCPFEGCPERDSSFSSCSEYILHLRDVHDFNCPTPYCVFYEVRFMEHAGICSVCFREHPELRLAKKLYHNMRVSLQETEFPPSPPSKRPPSKHSMSSMRDNSSSKSTVSISETQKQRLPTGWVSTSNKTADLSAGAIDKGSDNTGCGCPDCEDCGSVNEVNWEPFLNSLIQIFGDRAMNEFHSITNPQWAGSSSRASITPRPSSSTQNTSDTSRRNPNNSAALKRGFQDRDSLPPDDRGDNDPKKPRIRSTTNSTTIDSSWACPYHNREILRSGVNRRYRACASCHYDCLSSLKEHLYRKHLVFQCERCGCEFPTHDERMSHLRQMTPCGVKDLCTPDGVTEKKKERLKSRKDLPQDKVKQWNLIYEILFPGEEIPSPYYNDQWSDFVSTWSRKSLVRPPRSEREAPTSTRGISENSAERALSMSSSLIGENGHVQSRDSEEIKWYEEFCKKRLSEQFRMVMESELRSVMSGIPDKIRDAYDAVRASVVQPSLHSNSDGSSVFTRNSLRSIEEVSAPADGPTSSALRLSGTNSSISVPPCFDAPPHQESSKQIPTLEQAKDKAQQPCYTVEDSGYYSLKQVDYQVPSHESPSKAAQVQVTSMSDDAMNSIQENPLRNLYLISPLQETFDFPEQEWA